MQCFSVYGVQFPRSGNLLSRKKTDDVSKWLIISLIGGLSLWVFYGILKGDIIIVLANAIGVSLNLFLLFLKWRYTKSDSSLPK